MSESTTPGSRPPTTPGSRPKTSEADRRRPLAVLATGVALLSMAAAPWLAATAGERGLDGDLTGPDPMDRASVAAALAERSPAFPQPGSVPPGFALPVLEGEEPWIGTDTVRLTDFLGRWVYLDVFGSWCPPCRRKQPKMLEIASDLEERGAVVLGLLIGDRPQAAAEWLEANGGMAYPYLVLDAETERAWGLTGAPMGFLISPQGRVERLCFGCSGGPNGVESLPDAVR